MRRRDTHESTSCLAASRLMLSLAELLPLLLLLLSPAAAAARVGGNMSDPVAHIPDHILKDPNSDRPTHHITLRPGYKEFASYTKHIGQRVKIICDITGSPLPSYTWLHNGAPISAELNSRTKMSAESYGAALRIKPLRVSDAGQYTCVGTNAAGRRRAEFTLAVKPYRKRNRRPKVEERPTPAAATSTRAPAPVVEVGEGPGGGGGGGGFCQKFTSNVCHSFLPNDRVFVPSRTFQHSTAARLTELLDKMHGFVDRRCAPVISEAVCRFNFRSCSSAGRPRSLCRRHCSAATALHCAESFVKLRTSLKFLRDKGDPSNLAALLPDCQSLGPDDLSCLPLRQWQTNFGQSAVCYNGTGADYAGLVERGRSGRRCLRWSSFPGYGHVEHSFCANAGSRRSAPWCFVTDTAEWELCDLQPCPGAAASPTQPPPPVKEMLPVFAALAALALLAAVTLLVCCLCRRPSGLAGGGGGGGVGGEYQGVMKAMKMTEQPAPMLAEAVPFKAAAVPAAAPAVVVQATDFPLSRIRFGEEIGESQHGKVYKGELIGLYSETSLTPVAIKCLNASADARSQEEFRRSAQLQWQLQHPSLLCLLGVSLRQTPRCCVLELPAQGDLHELVAREQLTCQQVLHAASQVAAGLQFLASRGLQHRDVAARNVLLGAGLQCKLSDLGQCREQYSCDYYRAQGASLPIRWMAPEAILYGEYSERSDVYSFGVLLWETWHCGRRPHAGASNSEVIELVRQHQLLPRPPLCPDRGHQLLLQCWAQSANHRPSAACLSERIGQWQSELLAELSTSSHGSGHTNSTGFSETQQHQQRVIAVPVPPPPRSPQLASSSGSSGHSLYSTGAPPHLLQQQQQQQQQQIRHGLSLHVPV